jgi:hypothetical protein
MAWLEAGRNPVVGWREVEPDVMGKAAAAAVELSMPVTVHDEECDRGKVGGDRCSCTPQVVQPGGRA